jgi:MYXO-CTERM domain-containing protein
MRKTLGITLTTAALMFGGAGVANATAPSAPVPSSTTTTLADDATTTNHDSDKTGLWGLAGLLGLLGLAGLKRRNDTNVAAGAARGPGAPRV